MDSLEGGAYRWKHGLACRVKEALTPGMVDAHIAGLVPQAEAAKQSYEVCV